MLRTVVINRNVKKNKTTIITSQVTVFFPFICLLRRYLCCARRTRLGCPARRVVRRNAGTTPIGYRRVCRPCPANAAPYSTRFRRKIDITACKDSGAVRDFVRNKPFCDQTARLLRSWVVAHRPFYYFVLSTR